MYTSRFTDQLLAGLQHCHERGILHRDIKGSNLLIDRHGVLKIGDFGLANYYGPGRRRPLTSRVVTLWYRAPELLLGSTDYGVDLWSAGCLLAEMFFGKPLLRATNEVEQLFKIFSLCGSPGCFSYSARSDVLPDHCCYRAVLQHPAAAVRPLGAPVVYKEEAPDTAASKPKARQRSQRRKDNKLKTEEQRSEINTGSPNNEEDKVMHTENSGKESDGTVIAAANASSSVKEPLDITINVASYSYSAVPRRFSVSPDQVCTATRGLTCYTRRSAAVPAAKTSHRSGSNDDHERRQQILALDNDETDGEPPSGNGSRESRSAAFMTGFEAAAAVLRGSEELPSEQYVLVDHLYL